MGNPRKMIVIGIIFGIIGMIFLPILFAMIQQNRPSTVRTGTLVIWNLYDKEDVYKVPIEEFKNKYNNRINIEYIVFEDENHYKQKLLEAFARGKEPDIFAIKNTWVLEFKDMITPYPIGQGNLSIHSFENDFVAHVSEDLIVNIKTDEGNIQKIYAIPTYIDNLALYYNKDIFRSRIPTAVRPAQTWDALLNQINLITIPDNSIERFSISAIALGRIDNIHYGLEMFYLLLLQNNANLYNLDLNRVIIDEQSVDHGSRETKFDLAVNFFFRFSNMNDRYYNWNEIMTFNNINKNNKEIEPFIKGKTAMIFGPSSHYNKILDVMATYTDKSKIIKINDIGISAMPQIDQNKPVNFAIYYPMTVSQNSVNSDLAWEFIESNLKEEIQEYFFKEYKKISPFLNLINKQTSDVNYGVFAFQANSARSLTFINENITNKIFSEILQRIFSRNINTSNALNLLTNTLNCILNQYLDYEKNLKINCLENI